MTLPAERASFPGLSGHWFGIRDGDPRAFDLYRRHYSYTERASTQRGAPNEKRISGPGEHLILLTTPGDALFVWYLAQFRMDSQPGVNCSVFRNESTIQSSVLIDEACALAWDRWPGVRLWTYVDPKRIQSRNPGYCFKCAGFVECGRSAKGLVILERVTR